MLLSARLRLAAVVVALTACDGTGTSIGRGDAGGPDADGDIPRHTDDAALDAGLDAPAVGSDGGSDEGTDADTEDEDAGSSTPDGGTDIDCSSIPRAGMRDMRWTHLTDEYSELGTVDGYEQFPDYVSRNTRFAIEEGHFLAIEFEAPPADTDGEPDGQSEGYIGTVTDSHAVNAPHTIAYSRCPGDFSEALPEGKCRTVSANSMFWWTTYDYGTVYDTICHLEPGETHYINIKYARGADVDESTCESDTGECGANFFFSK